MKRVSDIAIAECVVELRIACRRPIDEPALATIIERLRPQFEKVLDHPDGGNRWTDFGQRMRDNGRHLGALADFLSHRAEATIVGVEELSQAFDMVRDACTVRVSRTTKADHSA